MKKVKEQTVFQFYRYPPVGEDDWQYVYVTGIVRTLEMQLLTRTTFSDMASAPTFEQAVDSLVATGYAAIQTVRDFAEVQDILHFERAAIRELFADLMLDNRRVQLMRSRDDFANMRLAVRRVMTEKPVGLDYSNQGNVPPEVFEQVFGQENYSGMPGFPDYLQRAAEQAIVSYYETKDIRRIDFAIDAAQFAYELAQARQLESIFLQSLFRIQIDLTNIRTMLRLKWNDSQLRNVFIEGGFLDPGRFLRGLELGYETLPTLFFTTPYYEIVSSGVSYLTSQNSFLRLEQLCEDYTIGFLRSTSTITAGPQPIIAYLLLKENEIRKVRLILTAKKHGLETNLVLDRLSEGSD